MRISRLRILAKAFAKVNPRLKVLKELENGYHDLEISFLSVNLADRMVFSPANHGDIRISTGADIPKEENLCYRVAKQLRDACPTNQGVKVTLEKQIPIGGGLGGGSSDAATTLICLNRLWDCKLSRRELIKIGENYGADVPFFFYGGYCTGTGKGSELRKKENALQDRFIPLIVPPFSQLTSQVYSRYDQLSEKREKSNDRSTRSNRKYPPGTGNFTVENDLQGAAIDLNPELEAYLDLLRNASTIQTAGVSGSGSSIFGISNQDITSREIREELERDLSSISKEAELYIARPTNHGQMIREEE